MKVKFALRVFNFFAWILTRIYRKHQNGHIWEYENKKEKIFVSVEFDEL